MFSEQRRFRKIKGFFMILGFSIALALIVFVTYTIVTTPDPTVLLDKAIHFIFDMAPTRQKAIDVDEFAGDWKLIKKTVYGTTGTPIKDYNTPRKVKVVRTFDDLPDTDFVNVDHYIKHVQIDLENTSERRWIIDENNEDQFVVTPDYHTAILRVGTTKKLAKAAEILYEQGYQLVILEAYRSLVIQQVLRDHYQITQNIAGDSFPGTFVAYPGRSNHQKGTAVDVTLVDIKTGERIAMPTRYLDFSRNISANANLYSGDIKDHVLILQAAMVESGFKIYDPEWWHFNDYDLEKKVDYMDLKPDDYK